MCLFFTKGAQVQKEYKRASQATVNKSTCRLAQQESGPLCLLISISDHEHGTRTAYLPWLVV